MKRKKSMERLRKITSKQGITLITLVITILIIIILATVTINFAFGDNGLIKKAEEARDLAINSTDYESNARANLVSFMNEFIADLNDEISGGGTEEPEDPTPPEPTYPTEVEGVKIPNGFYYVGGTKEEGIVISDEEADAGKGTSHEVAKNLQGNQFVWIPVEDDALFKRYKDYLMSDNLFQLCTEPCTSGYEGEGSEYNIMKQSVLTHNGFFVGRYETGIESGKAVIKQGKEVYNNIMWAEDMTSKQGGAVEVSQNFAKDNEYSSVTSTLIYGVQWDAIMNYIDPKYATHECAEDSFVVSKTGTGNDTGDVLPTGSNEDYEIKNIYDLSGNVAEWTMEAIYNTKRIARGLVNSFNNISAQASLRNNWYSVTNTDELLGFRIALYLK